MLKAICQTDYDQMYSERFLRNVPGYQEYDVDGQNVRNRVIDTV